VSQFPESVGSWVGVGVGAVVTTVGAGDVGASDVGEEDVCAAVGADVGESDVGAAVGADVGEGDVGAIVCGVGAAVGDAGSTQPAILSPST